MAERRYASSGTDRRYRRTNGPTYIYGNVIPKPVYEPERRRRQPEAPRRKHVSRQVRRNRRQALQMNPGYVFFIAVAAILTLVICVNYVNLQSRITSRSKNITVLQQQLAELKEENTTRYNTIMDSVNLDEVREKAQEELGMQYASPDQIVEYDSPSADYVMQYESIPENGIIARADKK